MRSTFSLAVSVLTAGMLAATLAGCAANDGSAGASSGASQSPGPMSSTQLPITPRPTSPPTSPSDATGSRTVAGRVTAVTADCVGVVTDDGTAWALTGGGDVTVAVGDTVLAKVAPPSAAEAACGQGTPARIVSLQIVR